MAASDLEYLPLGGDLANLLHFAFMQKVKGTCTGVIEAVAVSATSHLKSSRQFLAYGSKPTPPASIVFRNSCSSAGRRDNVLPAEEAKSRSLQFLKQETTFKIS